MSKKVSVVQVFPRFKSPKLNGLMTAFDARRRSLTRSGLFEISTADDADGEWVRVAQTPLGNRPRHMLDVSDSLAATYFIISSSRATGGRTLLAIRNMQLVENPTTAVQAFEGSLSIIARARPGELSLEQKDAVRLQWKNTSIGIAE